MVSKGLKVGDTFTEGVSTYIVEQVLPNGDYISRRVITPVEIEEKPTEKKTRSKKSRVGA